MLKIPNGKKYMVFIKICKTGSTSTVKTFKDLNAAIYIQDIFVRGGKYNPEEQILYVQELSDLKRLNIDVKDCFLFTIARNPYDRALSGWHYHPSFKDANSFLDTLKNPPQCAEELRDPNLPNWHAYSSFLHLTKSMTESLTCDGKFHIDHFIKLENYDKEFVPFCENIGLNSPQTFCEKKNVDKKYAETKLSRDELDAINKLFANDFTNFGYDMK